MSKFLVSVMAAMVAANAIPARAAAPTRDYLNDKFDVEQILDWGDRPVFSADSKRIAFTIDDEHLGPAYEMDLATRKVHCLTCRWGANGVVARVYYLSDGSYLLTGPASLDTAETTTGAKPQSAKGTYLYWMPADASTPPQALGAAAVGEIALDYDHSAPGEMRIAWGEMQLWGDTPPKYRMLMGSVVNDGKRAWLVNRTVLHSDPPGDPNSLVTYTETYDFIDDGKSILFFTGEKGRLYNGMYKLDIATGKTTSLQTDAQHNETHSFPDIRYGLEESNRASDPTSPYRGVSGHRGPFLTALLKVAGVPNAEAMGDKYGGKPFDLYLLDWQTGKVRRLTNTNELGGEAHQSTPARDGKHIAYSIRSAVNSKYAGKTGLFLGTFTDGK